MIVLTLLWLAYFLLHSLFASLWLKQWVATRHPALIPWYRILFNVQAVILILPPLAVMWWLRAEPLWRWEGPFAWLAYGLMLLAGIGFFRSLSYYDSHEFLGIRQLQRLSQDIRDQERLHISPMHRFVRHPWYSLGLLLIWTQDMDAARLVSAILVTLYLLLGSRLEERKLLIYHGETYREYRKRVPGLIPLPWRYLSRREAEKILRY
ncbi:MAG: hypothetical protein KZQ88_06280 [Candidatus Thiodiazotropha sp. (ex Dulcina madagascariensis)]|nr:hypothetical protein [Candidatus Thiodiazotropha sp. (ex Dulcina madagascariensis)]MCU7925038.1 hypothetical protein [Candidatus Thiodiazotropha sp. (ex Dulcina madagascariensis)]